MLFCGHREFHIVSIIKDIADLESYFNIFEKICFYDHNYKYMNKYL